MSRRRRPPRASNREIIEFTIRILCTGRGTHPPQDLATVDVYPSGSVQIEAKVSPFQSLADLDSAHLTYPFLCRTCGLDSPLQNGTLEDRARRLAEAGRARWDISDRWPIVPK